MLHPIRATFPLALLLLLAGCSTTRPPQPFPGVGNAPGVDPATLAIVREADHVFIDSIDGQSIPQFDVNDLNPGTYRQFQVPPGPHVLTVFFRQPSNLELITAGPRQLHVDLQPRDTCTLRPNRIGWDTTLGSSLRIADWRPELTRDGDRESAGIAAVDR